MRRRSVEVRLLAPATGTAGANPAAGRRSHDVTDADRVVAMLFDKVAREDAPRLAGMAAALDRYPGDVRAVLRPLVTEEAARVALGSPHVDAARGYAAVATLAGEASERMREGDPWVARG